MRGLVNLLKISREETVARARSERLGVIVLGGNFSNFSTEQIVADLRAETTIRQTPILLAVPASNLLTWPDAMSAQIDGFIPIPVNEDDLFTHITTAFYYRVASEDDAVPIASVAKLLCVN